MSILPSRFQTIFHNKAIRLHKVQLLTGDTLLIFIEKREIVTFHKGIQQQAEQRTKV